MMDCFVIAATAIASHPHSQTAIDAPIRVLKLLATFICAWAFVAMVTKAKAESDNEKSEDSDIGLVSDDDGSSAASSCASKRACLVIVVVVCVAALFRML